MQILLYLVINFSLCTQMRIGQCVHALLFRAKESAKPSSAPFIHMKQKSANVKGHFSRSCVFQAYNERMTLSVCMIVRDEEKILSRCLESLRGEADELIIVDTGSRDKTAEIARKYTDRVYFYPPPDRSDFRSKFYSTFFRRPQFCLFQSKRRLSDVAGR